MTDRALACSTEDRGALPEAFRALVPHRPRQSRRRRVRSVRTSISTIRPPRTVKPGTATGCPSRATRRPDESHFGSWPGLVYRNGRKTDCPLRRRVDPRYHAPPPFSAHRPAAGSALGRLLRHLRRLRPIVAGGGLVGRGRGGGPGRRRGGDPGSGGALGAERPVGDAPPQPRPDRPVR